MIKYKYLPIMIFLSCIGCTTKTLKVEDYIFLQGKWNSAGTDSYEEWYYDGKTLNGVSSRVIKNELVKVDSMQICTLNNELVMNLHLKYTEKGKATYVLQKSENNDYFFYSKTDYPNQILYRKQSGTKNLIVKAGENVFDPKKSFEFLYIPSK